MPAEASLRVQVSRCRDGTESRWRDHGPYPSPDPYNIGILLGKGSFPGTGRRRHRAVLLKYALDALRVCPSALIEIAARAAGAVDHLCNVVWLQGRPFLCDALDFPTELRDAEALFLGLCLQLITVTISNC